MSYTIRNAAPRPILRGIKDESGRTPVLDPELIPTHLPHVFLFTERGETLPQLVSGDKLTTKYGRYSFDFNGPYANHQTMLTQVVNAEGNQLMVQRLVPPGANPAASLRLSVDVSAEMVPTFQRGPDGRFLLNALNQKIPTGDVVEGFNLRWVLSPTIGADDDGRLLEAGDPRLQESGIDRILDTKIGLGAITTGGMTSSDGVQSMLYPILDIAVQSFGDYGNRMGIKLSAPTTRSALATDVELIEDIMAYLYRMEFVERDLVTGTAKTIETLFGERSVDFCFKPNAINKRVEKPLYIDDAILPSYSQEAAGGREEILAPFGDIHVYQSNLEMVLDLVQQKEAPHGYVESSLDHLHTVNIFTGHDWNDIPYETLVIKGPSEDGILFTENSVHYAQGGFDGVLNFETFDSAVRYQLENYGDLEAKTLDDAMYPQSVIYDTGFSLETKKALYVPMGRRPDLWVVVSTQDVSQPQNTPSEESSLAVALRTAARLYPESVIYGTATCRAITMAHSGYLLNSNYRGLLPLTIEFAQKCSTYMGAGDGFWKNGLGYDMPPNNQVKMFKGLNAEWRKTNVRENDWDAGMVWVQNYNRRSQFFPAVQTVYSDDSSVLNSAVNMMVSVELQKVAQRVWRDLTGISYLTPAQFIERSNRLIEESVRGKFDNRVIIVPETYYTQNDEQRGYSWSCNIHMYAPNMMTVGTFTVIAHRIGDFAG